jgi:hypothetical protein
MGGPDEYQASPSEWHPILLNPVAASFITHGLGAAENFGACNVVNFYSTAYPENNSGYNPER